MRKGLRVAALFVALACQLITGWGGICWADDIGISAARVTGSRQAFNAKGIREVLTPAALNGSAMLAPVSFTAFAPLAVPAATANRFEGRLILRLAQAQFHLIRDDNGDFKAANAAAQNLPVFDFSFVQSGSALIPASRGAIPSDSPDWEFILEPGRVWDEAEDRGFSRASLPFTLEERNANCMHIGVLTFLFKGDGAISKVAYEIGSETCLYAKFDMWGLAAGQYVPESVPNALAIAEAYKAEVEHRLPTKPISALAVDYPGIDPSQFGFVGEINPNDMTVFGIVVNGVNYVGGCNTRFGVYPYCAELDLPSYSLAKSIFAGEAAMRMELLYPGTMSAKIANYVPSCAKAGTWSDVTFANALDMATGHYNSSADQADENAPGILPFFMADSHEARIAFACNHYSRRAMPGTRWVYHTTDIYILGSALRAYYRNKAGRDADFFKDVLVDPIFHPLHLDPAVDVTRRSYDSVREPFTGWGLTLHRDDIAKLANFLSIDSGKVDGLQILDPQMLAAALQRDPTDTGLRASTDDFRYNNGFWAWNAQSTLGCAAPAWIPFMSGYGGIVVAMMPNHITYYYVSDGGEYAWARAAAEANKIKSFCDRSSDGN